VLSPLALERERRLAFDAVGRALSVGTWPDVPLAWNRRLRRAGRAVLDGGGRRPLTARIELSPAYFEVYPGDLLGILVHEAVHVGLAVLGLPHGHGPEFRAACAAAGGLQHGRAMPGRLFQYRCPVCRGILERRRRISEDRWCAACVEAAFAAGTDPFTRDRSLVLVGTCFRGPEVPEPGKAPPGVTAPRPMRYAGPPP
jgi:predicted SprT family Zn-dependent metalloprotease